MPNRGSEPTVIISSHQTFNTLCSWDRLRLRKPTRMSSGGLGRKCVLIVYSKREKNKRRAW